MSIQQRNFPCLLQADLPPSQMLFHRILPCVSYHLQASRNGLLDSWLFTSYQIFIQDLLIILPFALISIKYLPYMSIKVFKSPCIHPAIILWVSCFFTARVHHFFNHVVYLFLAIYG